MAQHRQHEQEEESPVRSGRDHHHEKSRRDIVSRGSEKYRDPSYERRGRANHYRERSRSPTHGRHSSQTYKPRDDRRRHVDDRYYPPYKSFRHQYDGNRRRPDHSSRTRHRSPRHSSHVRGSRSPSPGKPDRLPPEKLSRKPPSPKPAKRAWKFDSPPRDAAQGSEFTDHLGLGGVFGLSCEQQKAARELYVGNLPSNLDVNQLIEFFNAAMLTLNSSGIPGSPVSRAWIAADGHFAFVEFRTIEEATIALQLNGLNCMGYTLRIGRPKTYPVEYSALLTSTRGVFGADPPNPAAALAAATAAAASVGTPGALAVQSIRAAQLAAAGLGGVKKSLADRPDRLILLDLPPASSCPETTVNELLSKFGSMKVFQYFEIPKGESTAATGVCIFEYFDMSHQKALVKAVEKDEFGGLKVRVMPAEQAIREEQLTDAMEKVGLKEVLGQVIETAVQTPKAAP